MNEHRSILKETVERLFADLAADRNADPRASWHAIDELGLPGLLQSQEAEGFGGDWEDAGAVFKASAFHRLEIPVSETILARSWLAGLSLKCPDGMGGFLLHSVDPAGPAGLERMLAAGKLDWVLALGDKSWRLVDLKEFGSTSNGTRPSRAELISKDLGAALIAEGPLDGGPQDHAHQAALMRACQMAGAIEAMVALAIEYTRDRQQFGRSLSSFQAIQHQLALAIEESAAASCAAASACQAMALGNAAFEVAAAKWRVGKAADRVFDIAHQVHGAIGFTREYDLHEFSLRAQEWRRDFGNEGYWAREMARAVLSNRPKPLWHFLTARHDAILAAERAGAGS